MSYYWLVSVPTQKSDEATRKRLKDATSGYADVHDFKIPSLKVGTLDSLMSLSDKLQKMDTMVEGIAKKIERSYLDVSKSNPEKPDVKAGDKKEEKGQKEDVPELLVENKTAPKYIEEFKWNPERYKIRLDLSVVSDGILEYASKQDDYLKRTMGDFNEQRLALTNIERRETGTLLVKPLGQFVPKEKAHLIVEGEWITTLLVVVPVAKEEEFKNEYERLEQLHAEKEAAERKRRQEEAKALQEARAAKAEKEGKKEAPKKEKDVHVQEEKEKHASLVEDSPLLEKKDAKAGLTCNVVPRSAIKLTPDDYEGEFCLYRILVFKRGADTIKTLCRDKRYTVRPFKYDPEEEKNQEQEKKRLEKSLKKTWQGLVRWCKTYYSEVFASWVHLKAIRVFVEDVLRFGLPVNSQTFAIEPKKGKDTKLRHILKDLYKDLPNAGAAAELDPGETDLSGFGSDFFPYVYFMIKVTDTK